MEKDWTGSAIPSVLKGFTLIGQPIKAEEFKNAFGVDADRKLTHFMEMC